MRDNKTFALFALVLLILAGLWLAIAPEVFGGYEQNEGPVLVHSETELDGSIKLEITQGNQDDLVRTDGNVRDTWTYEFGSTYEN